MIGRLRYTAAMSSLAPAFAPPAGYHRIKVVASFDELVATPFGDGVNALCWPRMLEGDFGEVVDALATGTGITTIEDARLRKLRLSEAGKIARELLRADQERLRTHALAPVLDCVRGYLHATEAVPTHVQSWHVDSATAAADTWLCTYHGAASEGLCNEEARRRIEVPETRAALLADYGGADDEGFPEYLTEYFHDLHYAPLPGARPFGFGRGNLWRIACEYPGSPVPPCIHRAPPTLPDGPPRLLLIS